LTVLVLVEVVRSWVIRLVAWSWWGAMEEFMVAVFVS
jgi:hypothetical protein